MDEKFLTAYNEVVLDNFNSVLKQNMMFQTQIRFHDEAMKELGELREKLAQSNSSNNEIEKLNDENEILRNKVESFKTQLSSKDAVIRSHSSDKIERDRLQKALNEQAKEINQLNNKITTLEENKNSVGKDVEEKHLKKIKELEEEIINLKSHKVKLDNLKPKTSSKRKKETKKEENSIFNLSASGGTF